VTIAGRADPAEQTKETGQIPGSGPAIGAALIIALAGALPVLMVGALGVQIRAELGLTATSLGLSVSLWAAAAALGAAALGGLADRLGWQASIVLAALLTAVSLAGVGMLANTWTILAICMALGGLGHSLGLSSGNIAILAAVAPHRRALVLGLRQSAVPGAGLLAGLTVPLVAVHVGWRWPYAVALTAPVLVVALVLRLRNTHGRPTTATIPFQLARPNLPFAVFGVVAMCGAALVNALVTFTVSSLVDIGFTEASAGTLFILASLAAVVTRIVTGQVTDRRRSTGFAPISMMLLVGVVGFVLLASGNRTLAAVGVMLVFAGGIGWPGLTHYVVISRHPDQPGGASGLLLTAGFIGGAIGPVAFGALTDATGFRSAWFACAMVAAIGALASALSRLLYTRREEPQLPTKL
jgi:MFS family permease